MTALYPAPPLEINADFMVDSLELDGTLTYSERVLLKLLLDEYPRFVTMERMVSQVLSAASMRTHVSRIRIKLQQAGLNFDIEARRGVGYRLVAAPKEVSSVR